MKQDLQHAVDSIWLCARNTGCCLSSCSSCHDICFEGGQHWCNVLYECIQCFQQIKPATHPSQYQVHLHAPSWVQSWLIPIENPHDCLLIFDACCQRRVPLRKILLQWLSTWSEPSPWFAGLTKMLDKSCMPSTLQLPQADNIWRDGGHLFEAIGPHFGCFPNESKTHFLVK